MNKKLILIIKCSFILSTTISCNTTETKSLKSEIEKLQKENILSKNDSLLIFKSIEQNLQRKKANLYLDSLMNANRKQYDILIDVASERNNNGILSFDYNNL